MKKLHDKWLTGNSRSVNSDQIDSMLATFQEVQEKAKVGLSLVMKVKDLFCFRYVLE